MTVEPHSHRRNRPKTCLLVEDNRIERRHIERLLRQSRRRILLITVGTLAEARRVLEEERVDLILLDNSLPDGTGAEFALALKRHADLRNLPIAIVSEWPTPFMYAKADRAGVLGVFRKIDLTPEKVGNLWDSLFHLETGP